MEMIIDNVSVFNLNFIIIVDKINKNLKCYKFFLMDIDEWSRDSEAFKTITSGS